MFHSATRALAAFVLAGILIFSASFASAQTSSTALRGLIKDPSGAVIPNVKLTLKDTATGIEKSAVSGEDGAYAFPNLVGGNYQLTAEVAGFQKVVIDNVVIYNDRITDLPVNMKVGNISTTVEVTAAGVQLETTSTTIAATIQNTSILELPMAGRDTLSFALLMPGSESVGANRNSTFNGLPNASMNISIDGMNNNSQRFKSGGTSFFAFAPARLDAMEEVTVATAGQGAESAGEGAMNISFVTKRGTDRYKFQILHQFQNEALNGNSYMNILRGIVRPRNRQNYYVGSVGGPVLPFIHYFKDKLFFFAYFEGNPQPASTTYTNSMLQPDAITGNYTFVTTSGATKTLNVFDVAKQYGYPTAVDPTIKGMMNRIWATEQTPGVRFVATPQTPYYTSMLWNYNYTTSLWYPTIRLDYQINPKIAWHGSWNYRKASYAGAPPFPGSDAAQYTWYNDNKTDTWVLSSVVDWTVTPKMVNSITFGNQMNWEIFDTGFSPHQWSQYGDKIIGLPFGMSNMIQTFGADNRNNPVWQYADNLSWMKGRHSIKIGATLLHTSMWSLYDGYSDGILSYNTGMRSDDPVYNNFYNAMTAAGASTNTGDIGNFQALYTMLTGRISSISGYNLANPNTQKFEKFNPQWTDFAFTTVGLYAQDSFRWTPRFTLNYGLRWQLDGSYHGTIPIYSTIDQQGGLWGPSLGNFQPGTLGGNTNPQFVQNSNPYGADLVNPAPNLGFAWNPRFESGILKKIFGNDKTVVRSSFSMTFYNEGMNCISNYLPSNPGGDPADLRRGERKFHTGIAVPQFAGSDVFRGSCKFCVPDSIVAVHAQRRHEHQWVQSEFEVALYLQLDAGHSARVGQGNDFGCALHRQQVDAHVAHAEPGGNQHPRKRIHEGVHQRTQQPGDQPGGGRAELCQPRFGGRGGAAVLRDYFRRERHAARTFQRQHFRQQLVYPDDQLRICGEPGKHLGEHKQHSILLPHGRREVCSLRGSGLYRHYTIPD